MPNDDALDWADPAIQGAALEALYAAMTELEAAADAVRPDDDATAPDPAAFRAAVVRASVHLATLMRWAGGVG